MHPVFPFFFLYPRALDTITPLARQTSIPLTRPILTHSQSPGSTRPVMKDAPLLTIHTDGGARGNPGPAAFAYVIDLPDGSQIEEAGCLGKMTNNQAEYIALIRALEHALLLGPHHRLLIHSDSELMVKQMNGEYQVKNADLRDLYEQARKLKQRFAAVQIRHVRRAQNKHADQLYNEALDGKRSPQHEPALRAELAAHSAAMPAHATPVAGADGLNAQAVACLRAAAVAWSRGDPRDPEPAAVWRQLRDLIKRRKDKNRREPRSR
jgi:ribonuclease HI